MALREEIDNGWTWSDYPVPRCTRADIREVSADAQRSEAEAIADFHSQYTVAVRPGPAPLAELEQSVRQALQGRTAPSPPETLGAPPMVVGPGEHEEFLNTLFDSKPQWSKYGTCRDGTTVASH